MAPQIEGLTDLQEIGRGGFGVVYRAHQPAFGRDVAVKVLPGGSLDATTIARFERECRATGSLSGHPHIVRVYDAGVSADGDPYLVMDLLPGGTLAARVASRGPLDAADALALGIGISGALETAHRAGIVHRDVKPENILFSSFDEPQLVDFGIARMHDAYESRSGTISATIAHAAPEVIAGEEASARSDVYSLGSVLYFALRGATAFGRVGESSLAPLIARISSEAIPDLRPHGVPDGLASAIERAMAKSPTDRFASARDFGEALRAAGRTAGFASAAVPVAVPLLPPPAAPATAGGSDVTSVTDVRDRPPAPPVVAAAAATSGGRSRARLVALAAIALAILACIGVLVATGGDGDGDDERVAARSAVTTAPSTTVADPATTVTEPETSTTAVETATTEAPATTERPVTASTAPRTTTRATTPPTTTATTPTTAAPTTVPIRVPSAVVDPRSADPVSVEEVNGVPQRVRITLSWQAPADNGGSGPTEYRIRCTLMNDPGTGSPAPCRGGADLGSVPGNVRTFQPVVERVEPGPSTWLRWEIIPVNEAGAGPATTANVVVPNFVGLKSWEAYPYGRAVGLAVGGGPSRNCGREPSTICDQSRSVGGLVAGGATVLLSEQS